MRLNVYSQELTNEVIHVEKKSNTGVTYHAAQLILHSSDKLHHPHTRKKVTGVMCLPNGQRLPNSPRSELPAFLADVWYMEGKPSYIDATNPYADVREEIETEDDDRSAVTFWLPKSVSRREAMAKAFEAIAAIFRNSPPETGLD